MSAKLLTFTTNSCVGETGTVQAAEKCGTVVPSFYHPSCAILSYIVPSLQRVRYGILRTDVPYGTENTHTFLRKHPYFRNPLRIPFISR